MLLCAGSDGRRSSGSGGVHVGVVVAAGVVAGLLAGIRAPADGTGEARLFGWNGLHVRMADTDDVLVLRVHAAVAGIRQELRFRGAACERILVGAAAPTVGHAHSRTTVRAGVVRLAVGTIAHAGDRGLVAALFRVQPVAQ